MQSANQVLYKIVVDWLLACYTLIITANDAIVHGC